MTGRSTRLGSTKLSPDDLNQFEKKNISEALKWLYKKKPDFNQILTTDFCLELHKRMFNKTWRWAGTYRTQTVNIGITPFYLISTHLRVTLDNALYGISGIN
ncbi:hypothetical protein [Candidatus Regiella insecticola]|uniref:hypothetical protein n=1 Tax=Candidatus Regiella insecticola TaxID=138073 RepID=UPI0015967E7F|nr:hypothetical protein [Candidatus Regiella insecticola]